MVEIVSPSKASTEIQAKVADHHDAGAHLVWIVYPERREVAVYRSREEARIPTVDDALEGGDVLPGFHLPLAALFTD